MKHVVAFLAGLGLLLGLLLVVAPEKGNAALQRAVGYLDAAPVSRETPVPPAVRATPSALGPAAAVAEMRAAEREGWRAYEAGDFGAAAAAWTLSAARASTAEAIALRERIDRANLYRLLSEGVPRAATSDSPAEEAEIRRRIESLTSPTAGAFLEIADYAAAHGHRHHLAYVYERAFAIKHAGGGDAVQKKVTRALRTRRAAGAAPAPEILDAIIRELPTSEAAEEARGAGGGGIGGVEKRGEQGGGAPSAVDTSRLLEARTLKEKGDTEYKLAVPGSAQVNVHRRAALEAYKKARSLYEAMDGGRGTFSGPIHDCNQAIVELQKDLPIGK